MLYKYQDAMEMPEIRIQKVVEGLQIRIREFERKK